MSRAAQSEYERRACRRSDRLDGGYNNPNNGPVDTKITLTHCSVENVTIEAKGSVGGLIGHAGANPATYHDITNCTVSGCTLTSTKDKVATMSARWSARRMSVRSPLTLLLLPAAIR